MKTFIAVWCEYDYGQADVIFSGERVAKNWLYARMLEVDGEEWIEDQEFLDEEAIFEAGLAGLQIISLIEESS